MSNKRLAYEEKMDAQLKEWSAEIALLSAKADKAKAEAKIEYYRTIETLVAKHDSARTKLLEIRASSEDAWEDLKVSAEKIWNEVKSGISTANSRFSS
ncbi:MAG: hypothetical protein WAT51_09585 [Holophaga sp.]